MDQPFLDQRGEHGDVAANNLHRPFDHDFGCCRRNEAVHRRSLPEELPGEVVVLIIRLPWMTTNTARIPNSATAGTFRWLRLLRTSVPGVSMYIRTLLSIADCQLIFLECKVGLCHGIHTSSEQRVNLSTPVNPLRPSMVRLKSISEQPEFSVSFATDLLFPYVQQGPQSTNSSY